MSLVYQSDEPYHHRGGGVRHHLYLGGKDDAKDRAKLEQRGIRYILNVTPPKASDIVTGVPNYFPAAPGFTYHRVPVLDAPSSVPHIRDEAEAAVDFISRGLHHGSVLVHCSRGVSRSTTIVCLYLMRRANMSLDEALATIRRRRPQAQPIPAFMTLLRELELEWRNHIGSNNNIAATNSTANNGRKPNGTGTSTTLIGPTGPPASSMPLPKRSAGVGPSLPPDDDAEPTGAATSHSDPKRRKVMIGPSRPPPPTTKSDNSHKH